MLNIKINNITKKYYPKGKYTNVYVQVFINGIESEYTFTRHNLEPQDIKDSQIFSIILGFIKSDFDRITKY